MASPCLVFHMRGYHVFCDWRKEECDHKISKIDVAVGDTEYVNHCKYCFEGMVVALKEPWADEKGTPVKNSFATFL